MGGTDGVPEHLVEQIASVAVLGSLDAALLLDASVV